MPRRVPLPLGMPGMHWVFPDKAKQSVTAQEAPACSKRGCMGWSKLLSLNFILWGEIPTKLRLKTSAFFDGFVLQDMIRYLISLSLSTQGAEPQPATAHDPRQEAKALGSFLLLHHQSPQQALTSPCLWHQLLQSIILEMHWSSRYSVIVSDCNIFKGIIF